MRPFLSAHLHLLLAGECCTDYEGMTYCRERSEFLRPTVILELTHSRLVRFRLSHVGPYGF